MVIVVNRDYLSQSGDITDSGSDEDEAYTAVGQWRLAADGVRWWYQNPDGTYPAGGWAQLLWNGNYDWYYFDAEGYMVTGWITDDKLKYYLHPLSDGRQGYMYAGWHLIDGKWYYFSQVHDGKYGHLLTGTTTPDGYIVGEDGVWIK